MCSDYLNDYIELHSAGAYNHNQTMNVVNSIMEGGGSNNEDFRHPLRAVKTKLNKALLAIRHMSYDDKQKEMINRGLDVRSVLELAKEEYRRILDEGKWPAANHAKNSKAMNRNYGSVNMADSSARDTANLTKAVRALIQSGGYRDKSKDKCNNCGGIGHWAKDCPKKSRSHEQTL